MQLTQLNPDEMAAVISGRTSVDVIIERRRKDALDRERVAAAAAREAERKAMSDALEARMKELMSSPQPRRKPSGWVDWRPVSAWEPDHDWSATK